MHSIMLSTIFWLLNLLVVFNVCNSSVLICMSRLASMIVLPLTRVGIDEVEFIYLYFVLCSVSPRTVPRPRVGSSSLYLNLSSIKVDISMQMKGKARHLEYSSTNEDALKRDMHPSWKLDNGNDQILKMPSDHVEITRFRVYGFFSYPIMGIYL